MLLISGHFFLSLLCILSQHSILNIFLQGLSLMLSHHPWDDNMLVWDDWLDIFMVMPGKYNFLNCYIVLFYNM